MFILTSHIWDKNNGGHHFERACCRCRTCQPFMNKSASFFQSRDSHFCMPINNTHFFNCRIFRMEICPQSTQKTRYTINGSNCGTLKIAYEHRFGVQSNSSINTRWTAPRSHTSFHTLNSTNLLHKHSTHTHNITQNNVSGGGE